MATGVTQIGARSAVPVAGRTWQAVTGLRLALGWTVLVGALLFFFGTSWDIQWHTYVGRDRTLIPPHLMMLAGVILSGSAAFVAILAETAWTRHRPDADAFTTKFTGLFRGPLGAYVAGFAALATGIAFPLDSYWHALYGIDVAIWAPFHIMFLVSMGAVALGAVYMLHSATHLATRLGSAGAARAGTWGSVVAWATTLGLFTLLLFDALDGDHPNGIPFGDAVISLFPLLAGLLGSCVLVAAVTAGVGRWTARQVAAVYFAIAVVVLLLVPAATDLLVGLEELSYRRAGGLHLPLVAVDWPIAPIIAAFLLDRLVTRLHGADGSLPWNQRLVWAVLVCAVPIPVIFFAGIPALVAMSGLLGGLIALALGGGGVWVGSRVGHNMGTVLRGLER